MQSSGEFIARQDGDDESIENRFQTQIDVLNNLNLDFALLEHLRIMERLPQN